MLLEGSEGTLEQLTFENVLNGALKVNGMEAKSSGYSLESVTFTDNKHSNADWPSVRHNILCTDAKLSIVEPVALNETKGNEESETDPAPVENPPVSSWVLPKNCAFTSYAFSDPSTSCYFTGTVDAAQSILTADEPTLTVTLTGTNLIDCHLSFEAVITSLSAKEEERTPRTVQQTGIPLWGRRREWREEGGCDVLC